MNILLTGATGFIGSHFLAAIENSCKCLVRKGQKIDGADCVEVECLNSYTEFGDAFKDIDCVIHLAGLASTDKFSEMEYTQVNLNTTLHLAREAAKANVQRFVFISTIGVNGQNTYGAPFTESDNPDPYNNYTKSKWAAEQGVSKISMNTNMEVVIVRPALVYDIKVAGNFGALISLVKRSRVLPFALVNNKRSLISINNLIDFIIICTNHPKAAGETFLISDGQDQSIKDITNEIAMSLNRKLYQLPVPRRMLIFFLTLIGKRRQAQQIFGDLQLSTCKARTLLGWQAPECISQSLRDH